MSEKKREVKREVEKQQDAPLNMEKLLEEFNQKKMKPDCIKPEMLPDIDLYMDQVTTFMDNHLAQTKRYPDDKILTKTMINNYSKNNLLPPPKKKKYSKDHVLILTFIYYMKNLLSMDDIQSVLKLVKEDFFESEGEAEDLDLEDIYNEVLHYESEIRDSIMNDIQNKYQMSRESFPDTECASDTKSDLQDFIFICMLCYDALSKKQLIEQIIDYKKKPKN